MVSIFFEGQRVKLVSCSHEELDLAVPERFLDDGAVIIGVQDAPGHYYVEFDKERAEIATGDMQPHEGNTDYFTVHESMVAPEDGPW